MTEFGRIDGLSESGRSDIRALSQAVYPPSEAGEWPGRHIEWARPAWCVRAWNDQGRLVAYSGVLVREGRTQSREVRIGGIGGLMTHPEARHQGHARRCIERASTFFVEKAEVDFALLVCKPELIRFYTAMGWAVFEGRLAVTQRGEPVDFTFNRTLVLGVRASAPRGGVIDLMGPPW